MAKVGFLVNPIAGMGGRVGLKGTDGVLDEAVQLGAVPVAGAHADAMLAEFLRLGNPGAEWLTCTGEMGAANLARAGIRHRCIYGAPEKTGPADTVAAAGAFLAEGTDIVVFCGGDGTARDLWSAVGKGMPLLGIPSGVKMHSGVFGVTPAKTADVLAGFLAGELRPAEAEILDLDEDRYRLGEWAVRLYGTAMTPFEPTLVQTSKTMVTEASDAEIVEEIAEYVREMTAEEPETLFLLGPGGTLEGIGKYLGMDKTLLGVDAWAGKAQAGKDLNEEGILKLLIKYKKFKIILSPIGSQGFVLGRGNLQLSPEVVRRAGRDNILVVSTPAKLQRTPALRFDTGDPGLDSELAGRGWFSVVIGYRLSRLAKVQV